MKFKVGKFTFFKPNERIKKATILLCARVVNNLSYTKLTSYNSPLKAPRGKIG
jgi:hypothetical protein